MKRHIDLRIEIDMGDSDPEGTITAEELVEQILLDFLEARPEPVKIRVITEYDE